MQFQAALLGSATDHGGRIITGQPFRTVNGVQLACQGDLHDCPLPGHGVTAIIEGAPNHLIHGKPQAYVGCRTGCGARITEGTPRVVLSVNSPALSGGAVDHLRESSQHGLDEHFVLQDAATGEPAADMHYEMRVGRRPHEGSTAADGATDHAVSMNPEPVELVSAVQKRIGLKP